MSKKEKIGNTETVLAIPENQTTEKSVNQTVIYVGESLPNGVLSQYNIFTNGLPDLLQEDIRKCPAIKQLMVPIASLNSTRSKLEEQGSMEHTLNAQIKDYVVGSDR